MDTHVEHVTDKVPGGTFQSIVEAVSRTTNLPASIWVLDEPSQALRIAASVGLPASYVNEAFLALSESSVTGDAFKSGRVTMVYDVPSDPRWKYKDAAREMGWKSALCVPIQVHGTVIGVLSIYTFVMREFSGLEKQLLADFAAQIGLTLEAERRRQTLGRLLAIGDEFERLIVGQPTLVLQQIVEGACEVTDADCAVIYPYDADREEFYDIESVAYHGLRYPLELKDKPRRTGLGAYVVRQEELVQSNIEQEDPDLLKSPFIAREEVKAFMGITLKIANKVLGILYVDFRTPHQFSDEEKDTIRLFAHQAAIAIDNSRLYQQANTRAEALRKLYEVVPSLISIPGTPGKLEDILTQIAQNAQAVLSADLIDLYQYIQSRDKYVLPPIEVGERYDPSVRKDKIHEDDVVWTIVKSRQPQYAAEAQQESALIQPFTVARPDAPLARFVIREHIKSSAAVPLIVGAEVVGVLFANYRSPQTFPQQHRELVELFASQAAIAIRNARLFEQRKVLQDIARDITRILDKDALLQSILARSLELLGCEMGSIALLKRTTNQLEFQYAIGKETDLSVSYGEGLIGTAAEMRRPVRTGDVTKDTRYIKHIEATRSELDVPMLIGEELIGVLNAESTRYNAFDEGSEELAVILASQAAVALHNAALFEQRSALIDFGRASTSDIRLREAEVLELIRKQASRVMDTNNMFIALYDEVTDTVRFGLAFVNSERIDVATEERWQSRKAGKGRTEEIIHTKKPIFNATRAEGEAWYAQQGRMEYTGGPVWASWLGVPMTVGEKVLGVIATYHPERDNVYSENDLMVLQAMANQAAIALDNSHMFYDVNHRLRALVEFGQAVTSGIRLREDEVLELIYGQASQLMDSDNMYIALYDEATDTVRFGLAFVEGKRVDVKKEEGWQPRKAGKGLTEEIICTKKPIFIATKAEAEAWYAQLEHKEYVGAVWGSWLGVPMMVGEKILGVIATYHPTQDHVYSGDHLAVLQGVANQAAIVLDNADKVDRLVEAEKFQYLGLLAGGVAHRVGSKGGLIRLHVNNLRNMIPPEAGDSHAVLNKIERDNDYLIELSDALFMPAHAAETPLGPVDVNQLLREAIRRAVISPSVKFSFHEDDVPHIVGNRWLVDVFVELITNAVRAMSEAIEKRLTIRSQWMDGGKIAIVFEDTGRGIPPEDLPKLFQLFFTRDRGEEAPSRGGYGLWYSKSIITRMGGDLQIESEVGKGTKCTVLLPVAKEGGQA